MWMQVRAECDVWKGQLFTKKTEKKKVEKKKNKKNKLILKFSK